MVGVGRIRQMLPKGPVLGPCEDAAFTLEPSPSGASYAGPPDLPFSPLPLQIFGLHYDLDLVLISRHPRWTMHELARIDLPAGPLWIAKDADERGEQTVVADIEDIEAWVPEIPVPRCRHSIRVADRGADGRVDVDIAYTNTDGEPVELSFQGLVPTRPPRKRNGSTIDHSRSVAAAVLDLEGQTGRGRARIAIGGQPLELERLLGLAPCRWVLRQTQAGFAVASFVQRAAPGGFELERPAPGIDWPTNGVEVWRDDGDWVRREGPVVALGYRFAARDGGREWCGAEVHQVGRAEPVLRVRLDRALPDLSRPFAGRCESRFVLDVNGQRAHGVGRLTAYREGRTAVVDMCPTAPWWLAERPMRTVVELGEGDEVRVSVGRI